jgi:hypothetical protein
VRCSNCSARSHPVVTERPPPSQPRRANELQERWEIAVIRRILLVLTPGSHLTAGTSELAPTAAAIHVRERFSRLPRPPGRSAPVAGNFAE